MKHSAFNYGQLSILPIVILEFIIAKNPEFSIIAWVTPFLWLIFFLNTKTIFAFLTAFFCLTAVYATQHKVNILQGINFHITNLIFVFTYILPFLIARILWAKSPKATRWLILPLSAVTIEYLISLSNNGTWGSVGYTQDNIYLLQVISVTGIYGIVFIIYLNATLFFEVLQSYLSGKKKLNYGIIAAGLLVLYFAFGFVRIKTQPVASNTIGMVGMTFQDKNSWPWFQDVVWGKKLNLLEDREKIRSKSIETNKYFLLKTKDALQKYHPEWVIWNEAALLVLEEDYNNFIQRNSRFANGNSIDLGVTYFLINKNFPEQKGDNHFTVFSPEGKIVYDYKKNKPVEQMEPAVASVIKPSVFNVNKVKYSGAICADFDYPQLIRNISAAEVVFAPSADWSGIKDLHATMANARVIENGFSLFRIAGNGKSTISNGQGQILKSQYHLDRTTQIFVTKVPIHNTITLYSAVGDLFSFLCIISLIIISTFRFLKPKIDSRLIKQNQ